MKQSVENGWSGAAVTRNRACRATAATVALLAVAPLLFAPPTAVAAQAPAEIRGWIEVVGKADGSFELRAGGLGTTAARDAGGDASEAAGARVESPFDDLLVRHQPRWGTDVVAGGYTPATRESFNITKEIGPRQRKVIDRALARYNANKGHPAVPDFQRTNKKQAVVGLSPIQLDFDGQSTFAKTKDDLFFAFERADTVSRARAFLRGRLGADDGVLRGNLNITEVDIYLRDSFFDRKTLSPFEQTLRLLGMLHFSIGHFNNTWTHDLSSARPDHIDQAALDDDGSATWQQKQMSDGLLYGADTAARGARASSMSPIGGSVIRIDGLEPPPFDDRFSNKRNADLHLDFVRSEKKGFSQKKSMGVEVFKGARTTTRNRILNIEGASIDRDFDLGDGSTAAILYTRSAARFGQDKPIDDLKAALRKDGKPCTIANVAYDRCLEVTVRVSGHVEEGNKASSEQERYTLVLNETQ